MWVGLWRKLSAKELMLLNRGVGEDSWESLGLQEIQPVHSKGDQSWVFIGRTDAKAETPILRPPHAKSWLIGKDSDAGRDWGQEEKGTTEAEMAGWHHQLNGHEFEWTPEVSDGQGGLACCNSWGRKELDTIEQLNWTELNVSPKGTQEGEEYLSSRNHQTIATPYSEPWEAQDMKNTGYRPQIAEVYIKGMISVSPDSSIFPYIEKC